LALGIGYNVFAKRTGIDMGLPAEVECNKIIDQVIESRRSIRKFRTEAPARELIEQILQAGLMAPYAAAAVSREDFRRFIVIPRESSQTSKVAEILKRKAEFWSKQLEAQMQTDEFVRQHAGAFLARLKQMAQYGMPNIGKAPYYIIVAEQRGIPAEEHLSLAHCLQNMWLKAAALGLGMQLLSITQQLEADKEFCDLIKIPMGEFSLDGCLVGYPDMKPPIPKRPSLSQVTEWIE
jgi:nitroreductase